MSDIPGHVEDTPISVSDRHVGSKVGNTTLLIQFTVSPSPQLSGFPLHLRYSDIQDIVSTVESTGLHPCENEHVEYALAVCVHPYSYDVLSV